MNQVTTDTNLNVCLKYLFYIISVHALLLCVLMHVQ